MRAVSVKFLKDGIIMVEEIDIKSYKDLYKYLGCNIFGASMNRDRNMSAWVDDEGFLVSNNPVCDYELLGFNDPLAGNVVFTGGVDSEGETLPLPEDISTTMISQAIDLIGFTK